MSTLSPLELLSAELFTEILSHIMTQRDLNSLSKASRPLYHRTVPELYRKWSYHGLAKNPKDLRPLRMFLETMIWRPDLALHVKELDVREWGDCPRLEDYVGMFWENYDETQEKLEALKREKQIGTVGEEGGFWLDDEADEVDQEFVCESNDEYDEGSEVMGSETDSETNTAIGIESDGEFEEVEAIEQSELEVLGPLKSEGDEDKKALLLKAGLDLGFENPEVICDYASVLFEEDEEKQVIKLFMSLPNLQTIWMVIPEDSWLLEENELHMILDNTAALASHNILQHLQTLYICSPMHLGAKDHREYTLDLRRVLPFMRLPELRSVYTLTIYSDDDSANSVPINYAASKNTGDFTTLVYDEAELSPLDAIASLGIPKALKCFRWTGKIECFSLGTCFAPFQSSLGAALQVHKESLESLYLDIRYPFCNGDGHHANPFATLNNVRRTYSDELADKYERDRGPKTAIMIGSLRGFEMLKSLAIDVNSLIGHQNWASSSMPLADLLPPNLVVLTLFLVVSGHGTSSDIVFDNQLFYSQLLDLVRKPSDKLPKLKDLKVKLVRYDLREGEEWTSEVWAATFAEAERMCVDHGIGLDVGNASKNGDTDIPYFLEQTAVRNPGRDF